MDTRMTKCRPDPLATVVVGGVRQQASLALRGEENALALKFSPTSRPHGERYRVTSTAVRFGREAGSRLPTPQRSLPRRRRMIFPVRSEERRVGKECSSRMAPYDVKI